MECKNKFKYMAGQPSTDKGDWGKILTNSIYLILPEWVNRVHVNRKAE